MSRDKLYGDWERRVKASAAPVDWRRWALLIFKGVLIGLVVVVLTQGF